jgi:shikimate kinase
LVDTDAWIVEQARKPITRIFAEEGEPEFRIWETRALETLGHEATHRVISTGGGIVLAERNWPLLRALGPVVCLTAQVSEILKRVGSAQDRPLLAGEPEQVRQRVEALLSQRLDAYARADWLCPTDGKTPAEIAEQIIHRYRLNA